MKLTLRCLVVLVLGLASVGQVRANWDEDQERGFGQVWERHGQGRKNLKPVFEAFQTPSGKDDFPDYHKNNGIRCYRDSLPKAHDTDEIKGIERWRRCAVVGDRDEKALDLRKKTGEWFFRTNNPRVCRDKCLTDPRCRSFSWRPVTEDIEYWEHPTCRTFTEEIASIGLKVDINERDTADGWIYWDRRCGRCIAADFVPGQMLAVAANATVSPSAEENA